MQHFSDTCMHWQERNLVWMEKLLYHYYFIAMECSTPICQQGLCSVNSDHPEIKKTSLRSPHWCSGLGCDPDPLLAAWRWVSGMRWHASNLSSSCTWKRDNYGQFIKRKTLGMKGRTANCLGKYTVSCSLRFLHYQRKKKKKLQTLTFFFPHIVKPCCWLETCLSVFWIYFNIIMCTLCLSASAIPPSALSLWHRRRNCAIVCWLQRSHCEWGHW